MALPGSSFFSFTTSRPVAISMVVLAAVVFGVVGLWRLPVNLLPDISYPSITIRTLYPGAGPRDVEERVSEKIQENVAVIPGVRRVVSVSRPEVSDVILEFAWGTNMAFAVSDVRERLDRFFPPAGAERPLVLRYDPSLDPVLTLGLTADLSGGLNLVELRRIAEEEIEDRLAQIPGVAAVKVRGGDEEEIRIAVDEQALTALNLDVGVIGRRLAAENLNAASGSIEEGKTEFLVRALNEYRNLEEIENTILEHRGDVSIRLGEVARVSRVAADKEVISRINDRPCVLIDIQKEAGANIVELCRQVRERVFGTDWQRESVAQRLHEKPFEPTSSDPAAVVLEAARDTQLKRQMVNFLEYEVRPWGVDVHQLQDQSRFIQASVDDVLSSALKGGVFAIVVIFLFLRRFAATAILAISIPISLVATFAPMFLSDIDLNIMSLGGLALGVGMLVDNSIVVLESIAKMREEGHSLREAAVQGVSRVASAVTASTLTTVAVFFPIVFVEGVAGQLFHDQALTVVYALLMSLMVALFVIPMLATRGISTDSVHPILQIEAAQITSDRPVPGAVVGRLLLPIRYGVWYLQVVARSLGYLGTRVMVGFLRGAFAVTAALGWFLATLLRPLLAAFNSVYAFLDATYPRILNGALKHRGAVVVVALGLLLGAVSRIPHLGSELLPPVHQGEFWVDAFLPRDATVERTDEVMREIEGQIAAMPEVTDAFLASGVDKEELNDSDQGEHSARILVNLRADRNRLRQELEVQDRIRAHLEAEPRIQSYRFTQPSVLSFTAPLVVEVIGHNLHNLRVVSSEVAEVLKRVPGLSDIRSTLQRGNPEVTIRLDRDKLAALALDAASVTDILKTKVQGEVPTRFSELERKIDIRVRMEREEIGSVPRLVELNVNPKGYPAIPLGSVAEVQRLEGPSEIRRLGNLRGAEVQASLVGFDLGRTQLRVEAALTGLQLPRGIEVRLGGQKEDLEQSQNSLLMALALAVFLVYIVMASQFESIVQPLIILASLPLAVVGVVVTLEVLDMPLSVIVFLGAIVLAGIVVNNAIILIDQINRLRAGGMAKMDAIVRGAHTRLRPVLMTTMTTVLGLLPLTGWLAGLPLLGGSGDGIELRAPMAVTVIAGLLSSTLLTLVVIPVVYSLSDRKA